MRNRKPLHSDARMLHRIGNLVFMAFCTDGPLIRPQMTHPVIQAPDMGIMAGHAGEIRYPIVFAFDPFKILLAMPVRIFLIRPEGPGGRIGLRVQILHHRIGFIEFVVDRIIEFFQITLHPGTDVASTTILGIFVDNGLHRFWTPGMVSRRSVACFTTDIELDKGSFLIIGTLRGSNHTR